MKAQIIQLPSLPPGLSEAMEEWREHYFPCTTCGHERDNKGRLRFCAEGRHLWYAVLNTLPADEASRYPLPWLPVPQPRLLRQRVSVERRRSC